MAECWPFVIVSEKMGFVKHKAVYKTLYVMIEEPRHTDNTPGYHGHGLLAPTTHEEL